MDKKTNATVVAEDTARYERLLDLIGLPKNLRDASIEGIKTPAAREFVEWYFEEGRASFDKGEGIFIGGLSFTGKSAIASLILRHCNDAGIRCRFTTAPELLRSLARGDIRPDEVTVEDKCLKAGFLVVDDIGLEHCASPGHGTMVSELISRRIDAAKPCLITTSKPRKDLENTYGIKFLNAIDGNFHKITLVGSYIEDVRNSRKLFGK